MAVVDRRRWSLVDIGVCVVRRSILSNQPATSQDCSCVGPPAERRGKANDRDVLSFYRRLRGRESRERERERAEVCTKPDYTIIDHRLSAVRLRSATAPLLVYDPTTLFFCHSFPPVVPVVQLDLVRSTALGCLK